MSFILENQSNMKNLTMIFLFLAGSLTGAAQVMFGVQGGFSFSNPKFQGVFEGTHTSIRTGPLAGIMAGLNLEGDNFSLMQELNYTGKGVRFSGTATQGGNSVPMTGRININYVELPASLLYYLPVDGGHIFVGGGPYLAMAINGTRTYVYGNSGLNQEEKQDIHFGTASTDMKKWDYGFHAMLGYKLGYGSYLRAYYAQGIPNLDHAPGNKYTSRSFGISFGYFFGSGQQ
jgi:hypothetical protein